jgi:hypothetical protein
VRAGERGRERERERRRERERERESSFLKGMTDALAPFNYLVFNRSIYKFICNSFKTLSATSTENLSFLPKTKCSLYLLNIKSLNQLLFP